MKYSVAELEQKAHQCRKRFLDIFTGLGYGHLTSAFSWAEIATVLYNEIMQLPPALDETSNFDKMVISKGHGTGMLFPIFEDLGYFTEKELMETIQVGGSNKKLRKLYYPGFDFYGGSLGIGLGIAAGLAKGARLQGASWKVYCLVGDAECYEGSIWEAMNFAGHQQLDNLIAIVDRNGLGCSDFTEHMLKLEPFREKWLSCNWDVCEIDGHDVRQIYETLSKAGRLGHNKPQCIIADTKKGKGLEHLVDRPLMHGYIPKDEEEICRAYTELS